MFSKYGFWQRMLDMLTSAYNRSDIRSTRRALPPETNIGRLFYLIAEGFEMIYENAGRVKEWDDLDNAQGAVLDRYGANLGVTRGAAGDALYRIFIKVKMIAQLSGGDDAAIIKAAAELLGVEYADLLLEDVYPAKIDLYVDQSLLSEERLALIEQIAHAIKRALLAGVGIRLYLRTYRTYQLNLPVHRGGAIMSRFQYVPVGQDREETWEMNVAHGGAAAAGFSYQPTGKNRSHTQAVPVAHGGFLQPVLAGGLPDMQRVARGIQTGAGGVYTRVHIKAKRIE